VGSARVGGGLRTLTEKEYSDMKYMYRYSKIALAYMADYSDEDVMRCRIRANSSTIWNISPPDRMHLVNELYNLNTTLLVRAEWAFERLQF
jgi:hypothetical protein